VAVSCKLWSVFSPERTGRVPDEVDGLPFWYRCHLPASCFCSLRSRFPLRFLAVCVKCLSAARGLVSRLDPHCDNVVVTERPQYSNDEMRLRLRTKCWNTPVCPSSV